MARSTPVGHASPTAAIGCVSHTLPSRSRGIDESRPAAPRTPLSREYQGQREPNTNVQSTRAPTTGKRAMQQGGPHWSPYTTSAGFGFSLTQVGSYPPTTCCPGSIGKQSGRPTAKTTYRLESISVRKRHRPHTRPRN